MSQFEARVKTTLDLSGIDSQLQKISKKQITLTNVKIGNIDLSSLQSQGAKAGQALGNSIAKSTQAAANRLKTALDTKKFTADLASVRSQYQKLSTTGATLDKSIGKNYSSLQKLKNEITSMASSGTASTEQMVAKYNEYNTLLATTQNQLKTARSEQQALNAQLKQFASASQVATTQNKMNQFLNSGTKAAKEYGSEVRRLVNELNELSSKGSVKASDLQRINESFNAINQGAKAAGKNVTTFGAKLKGAFSKLTQYVGASTVIYGSIRAIKSGINEVVELDNALVDLKKTSSATTKELNDFYYSANDSAKKYGTSTKDIIQGAADWSRLGYNLKDSQIMSEVSSIFKSISPGMTIEKANDGLISVMKAKDCLVA